MSGKLRVGFIGGGNMATALIGGMNQRAMAEGGESGELAEILVIEPNASARLALEHKFGVKTYAAPHPELSDCTAIVLAVKPQQFREAAESAAKFITGFFPGILVISIAAGIRSGDIVRWLAGHELVIRCMPNTPALIGAGITGLFARPAVDPDQKRLAETLLGAVGETLWVDDETRLDAVTAVSGSGPAYVFYFIEALQRAALDLGLDAGAARRLALQTFLGASKLAAASDDPVEILRERVTSKGGTTYAALTRMEADGAADSIVQAVHAAAQRSAELGDEFGKD